MKRKPTYTIFYGQEKLTCFTGTRRAIINRLKRLNTTIWCDDFLVEGYEDGGFFTDEEFDELMSYRQGRVTELLIKIKSLKAQLESTLVEDAQPIKQVQTESVAVCKLRHDIHDLIIGMGDLVSLEKDTQGFNKAQLQRVYNALLDHHNAYSVKDLFFTGRYVEFVIKEECR